MIVYGTSPRPGTPGTWDYEITRALHYAVRAHRRWPAPLTYGRYTLTVGTPRLPYGRSVHALGHLTHIPRALLFAWRGGRLAGRMVVWECGSTTAYFRMQDEPDSQLCPVCVMTLTRRQGA